MLHRTLWRWRRRYYGKKKSVNACDSHEGLSLQIKRRSREMSLALTCGEGRNYRDVTRCALLPALFRDVLSNIVTFVLAVLKKKWKKKKFRWCVCGATNGHGSLSSRIKRRSCETSFALANWDRKHDCQRFNSPGGPFAISDLFNSKIIGYYREQRSTSWPRSLDY